MPDKFFWEQMQINDMLVIDTIRKYGRDTIYFKDKDSKFIWNNYMHANQLGVIKPDELVGKSDFDFFPKEFAEKARQVELEIMRTGKPVINIEEELSVNDDGGILELRRGSQPSPWVGPGSPIFPSGCEGKLGVALESLQGRRDLT